MRMVEVIERKRDGEELSREEIGFFIDGYVRGEIPDYQASALLMAVMLRGMTDSETRDLTLAMARSGETLDLSDVADIVVDKHSTGGVGDKVSLVAVPAVAAAGLPVGKMSGRGLGFSGGTLDKLESIPGYRVDLSVAEFKAQLRDIGIVLTGQSANLAPADGKLYALRDVTGTVPSLPLIVSSIMSKKIAAGADAIVLDVKVGTGAFMRTLDEARALALAMVRIGHAVGRRVAAHIADMNQPLGRAVGNGLEIRESLEVLRGGGPHDLIDHCLRIAGELLRVGGVVPDLESGIRRAAEMIETGAALEKFRALIAAQGGDVRYVDEPERFPVAPVIESVTAPRGGYVAGMEADEIGMAVVDLGGGREKKGDPIDHRVGVVMQVQIGDAIQQDQPLFTVHAASVETKDRAVARIKQAIQISQSQVERLPLFYDRIT
ncbi:MAG: thymidine phosphorylase [Chloroflexi bacterium]|nr:thymidine phosphorylase [Chloroflexota bacterium]